MRRLNPPSTFTAQILCLRLRDHQGRIVRESSVRNRGPVTCSKKASSGRNNELAPVRTKQHACPRKNKEMRSPVNRLISGGKFHKTPDEVLSFLSKLL